MAPVIMATVIVVSAIAIFRFALSKYVSTAVWVTIGCLVIAGFYFAIVGPRQWAVFGALGLAMFALAARRVPEAPPHVGLLTFWNRRLPILLSEGTHMLADYFPFMIGVNPVKVEKSNFNFAHNTVRCKGVADENGKPTAGGAVTVEVAATTEPDYKAHEGSRDVGGERVIKYLNAGGEEGVKKILCDIINEEVRILAGNYTWEEFTFLKGPLAASLIMMVSTANLRKLPRDAENRVTDEAFRITPEEYERLPIINKPLEYYTSAPDNDERHERGREMEVLIRIVRENGVGDIIDLGIQITRLNVVKIEPEGQLSADAELAAREIAQRRAEELDTDTAIELARKYVVAARAEGDLTLKFSDALERVRVDRGRAKEFIVRSSGNPFADAAALMNR